MSPQPCLAVFGGSFDPPHISHVMVPTLVLSQGRAQRVIVVPCWRHPLGKVLSDYALRMRWVMSAMADHGSRVEISAIEEEIIDRRISESQVSATRIKDKNLEFVSTIDVLEEVARRHPNARVRLVIGSDIVQTAETSRWTGWADICARFSPIVIPRSGYSDASENVDLPKVSSSEIRRVWKQTNWLEQSGLAQRIPHRVKNALASREKGAPCIWLIGNGVASRNLQLWLEERGYRAPILGARESLSGTSSRPEGADPQAIWLMVLERQISVCAQALADAEWVHSSCPVVHGSGSVLAKEALHAVAKKGHPVATIHPVCSLRSELRHSLIRDCAFGIEGDERAKEWAIKLIDPQPIIDLQPLDTKGRQAYHAACALLANHMAVPYDSATRVMQEIGLDLSEATVALQSLGESAWKNLQRLGIPKGVSGPMVRGDLESVQRHIDALSLTHRKLYQFFSERLKTVLERS